MIPARYRDALGNGVYVTLGFDQNLIVLTEEHFANLSERARNMSLTDPTARMLKRLLFSHAEWVEIDRAGRILIPQWLRKTVGLNGKVMVVGMGDYFEIWPLEHWEQHRQILEDPAANAQRFASLELPL